ncbi:MAG: hypothetical protein H7841_06395 [Magnetospirillum sp. WYHS-4]
MGSGGNGGNGTAGAYLDLVAAGYGYSVPCGAGDAKPARAWLSAQGVRFFESRGLFGFRNRGDALVFAAQFSPGSRLF